MRVGGGKLRRAFFFFLFGQGAVNRAGRKTIRAGRSALGNMPNWNTGTVCENGCAVGRRDECLSSPR